MEVYIFISFCSWMTHKTDVGNENKVETDQTAP